MTTTGSLRNDIAQGWEAYIAELRQAGANWERTPVTSGEGEDAWCARQVAEHIAGASGYFARAIGKAIGVDTPRAGQQVFETAAQALEATPVVHAGLVEVVEQVRDDQLTTEMELPPLGKTTLANVIGIVAYHLNDHAQQLKTLREA